MHAKGEGREIRKDWELNSGLVQIELSDSQTVYERDWGTEFCLGVMAQ